MEKRVRQRQITYERKLVIVGNRSTGKTCLVSRLHKNEFPKTYVPSVYENSYIQGVDKLSGKVVDLALWDTSTQDCYERLRPLSYTMTDVVLICFSIDDPESLKDVEESCLSEIVHFLPTTPRILVGCKADLRQDCQFEKSVPNCTIVTTEKAMKTAQRIGADYIECSAKNNQNIDQVFEMSLKAAMQSRRRRRRQSQPGCTVL